jgi:hypothetical protein
MRDFYRVLADKPWDFIGQAEDLVKKTIELGASDDELRPLRERMDAVERVVAPPIAAEDLSEIPVRIVVIGGDERQADYDRVIRNFAECKLGAISIEFRHTGWNGNWGHQFEEMRSSLDSADAVVVLRLIRTNLGRKVRSYAKRWIGCAGYSRSSIERAVAFGADMVRREKSTPRV